MLSRGELALTLIRRKVPGRSSPLRSWEHIGCETESADAASVSHTFFHYSLLFCGGFADVEEHIDPSDVDNKAVGRLTDRG